MIPDRTVRFSRPVLVARRSAAPPAGRSGSPPVRDDTYQRRIGDGAHVRCGRPGTKCELVTMVGFDQRTGKRHVPGGRRCPRARDRWSWAVRRASAAAGSASPSPESAAEMVIRPASQPMPPGPEPAPVTASPPGSDQFVRGLSGGSTRGVAVTATTVAGVVAVSVGTAVSNGTPATPPTAGRCQGFPSAPGSCSWRWVPGLLPWARPCWWPWALPARHKRPRSSAHGQTGQKDRQRWHSHHRRE